MDRQFLTHFCGLPIKIYDFVSLKSSSLRMKLLFKAHYFIGLLFKNIPTLNKNTVHMACLCAINRIIVLGTVCVLSQRESAVRRLFSLLVWMPPRSQYSVFCLVYGRFSLLCVAKDSKRASVLIRSVVASHRLLER